MSDEAKLEKHVEDAKKVSSPIELVQNDGERALMDAVKPKHKRKKKHQPVA